MDKIKLEIKVETDLETAKAILSLLDKKNIQNQRDKFVNKGPRY
jgi:hypothetical protein